MLSKTEMTKLLETILMVPGMNETIKVDLKLPRKHVLLLHQVIQRGLSVEGPDEEETSLLQIVPNETMEELAGIALDMLDKAGLKEINDKLNSF